MSEARRKILQMLAEGKITVAQSEELLSAFEKDNQESNRKCSFGEGISGFAESVQKQIREAMKKAEPPSHEFKSRIKEFGGWMQNVMGSMVSEFGQFRSEPVDGVNVEFCVPEPEGFSQCHVCLIENPFGSVTVREGPAFSLKLLGRISNAAMAGQPPNLWFNQHGLSIEGETLRIGFDRGSPAKAVLEMELSLPAGIALRFRSVSASINVKGPFKVEALKTVSGDVVLVDTHLSNASLETVSGDIRLDGGSASCEGISTSGDFRCQGTHLEKCHLQSISGDLQLSSPEVDESSLIKMNTTSGDIVVERIKGHWAQVEANSRTGNVKVRWEGTVDPGLRHGTKLESGQPGALFAAETVSGDIKFD